MLVSKLKRQLCEAFYVFVNPNTSQERTLIVRSWHLSDFIRKQVFLVKRIIEGSEHWKNDLLNPFNKHLGSVHNYLKKLTYYHKPFFFSKFSVQNVSDANQRSPEKITIKYEDVLSLFGYAGITIILPGILYIFRTSFQLSSDYFMKLGDNVCEIKSTFLHWGELSLTATTTN